MQNIKIKETQDLDLTALILEKKARQELKVNHGFIWELLYTIFVLNESKTMNQFKKEFPVTLFLRFPIFLIIIFWVMFMAQILGGVK